MHLGRNLLRLIRPNLQVQNVTHIKSIYADPFPIFSQSHFLLFAVADLGKGAPLFLNKLRPNV